jgi:hypothetical protein
MRPSWGMTTGTAVAVRAEENTSDRRWAQWIARGAEQDRKMNQRFTGVAVLVAGGLTVWLTFVLLFG